jgi:hypothetical protein
MKTRNATLDRILASLHEGKGAGPCDVFENLYDDMDRFYGRETEIGFGIGKIVFCGEIKLSQVGGALLSLLDTRVVPRERWFDDDYPQVDISAESNVISDEQVALALTGLLPAEAAGTVRGWSSAEVVGMLLKHGIEIAPKLEGYLCMGLIDEVDDLLVALKNDPGSNICAIHFTSAVFNAEEGEGHNEYTNGYVLHLSDAVSTYQSTQEIRRACQRLDVALHSGSAGAVEEQLSEMIHEMFQQISDPKLQAEFAGRLLQGSALRRVVPQRKFAEDEQVTIH